MKLLPVKFIRKGEYGDFEFMRDLPGFEKTLFLFNENVESYNMKSVFRGGGNACIRPWAHEPIPRSFGIPTGSMAIGGFETLTDDLKDYLSSVFLDLKKVIQDNDYDTVCYSIDTPGSDTLGTSIFKVDPDVLEYITQGILSLK
jgi:hypothetical protein